MKLHHISFNNLKRRKGKMIFLVLGLFVGIATVDKTVFGARKITPLLKKTCLNAVLLNRTDHSQHMQED